ncbi:MAG: phosphodiester glycosidase family protein [Deltaproteobacteria bacterium]|nr:phosphodiester glycosidase family protein [Deltaproteobacteria bacterium]
MVSLVAKGGRLIVVALISLLALALALSVNLALARVKPISLSPEGGPSFLRALNQEKPWVLRSEGYRESGFVRAEGQKEPGFLRAEGQKEPGFLRLEDQRGLTPVKDGTFTRLEKIVWALGGYFQRGVGNLIGEMSLSVPATFRPGFRNSKVMGPALGNSQNNGFESALGLSLALARYQPIGFNEKPIDAKNYENTSKSDRLKNFVDSNSPVVTTLTMEFSDMSGWPRGLRLTPAHGQPISDRRPFGGRNLKGATLERWVDVLEAFLGALDRRPKIGPVDFKVLERGLELARVKTSYGIRLGAKELTVFRVDPLVFAIRPYHENEARYINQAPVDALGWLNRLPKVRLVFNGGLYYSNRRAMGYLKRTGQVLESQIHPSYLGYLAQDGPKPGLYDGPARTNQDLWGAGTICQSYMALGGQGEIRARLSDKLASRSILGQDNQGRLLAVMVAGAATLNDLGLLAKELGLSQALGLDGGLEAQWAYRDPAPRFESGAYSRFLSSHYYQPNGPKPTLPVVLAVESVK